jgi:hypothetical protein
MVSRWGFRGDDFCCGDDGRAETLRSFYVEGVNIAGSGSVAASTKGG